MAKAEIKTSLAPRAIGPYSQAIRAGNFLFISGSIPVEPETGSVVSGGVGEQTRRVLKNIESILMEGGGSLKDVVKTTVFLKDLSGFEEMNRVYGEFFSPPYPVRSTVEVARLPKDVLIEIDAIAWFGQ